MAYWSKKASLTSSYGRQFALYLQWLIGLGREAAQGVLATRLGPPDTLVALKTSISL